MLKYIKFIILLFLVTGIISRDYSWAQSEIMKWQDGKEGCVTLTFDDGSINQFRIALPLMNERGFEATFFINTGSLPGSHFQPTFVGRPIQKIISESETIPTNKNNLFERCSALYYLAQIRNYPEVKDFSDLTVGEKYEEGKYAEVFEIVDNACSQLRKTGNHYKVEPINMDAGKGNQITWDDLKDAAEQGHEIANHTISHPFLPVHDKANILYQVEKCREDIFSHLGYKHTLSIECPYGIDDSRVLDYVNPIYTFVRNRLTEKYIKEILRGHPTEPVSSSKEYVQWQRGPLSKTPVSEMKGWVDKTIADNVWLLLVFHGIEGIGWEALTNETLVNYFNYIKKNESQLWIATFQDAFKYIRERMNTHLESETHTNSITVNLTNDLDKKTYDLPLTLRTEVPVEWESVNLKQAENNIILQVQKHDDIAFVQYYALPNTSEIVISRNK